jgi:FkbM family methyltransferase
MGQYRRRLRAAFMRSLHGRAKDGQVGLSLRLDSKCLTWHLRQDNHADYGVAGEIVMGAYQLPARLERTPTAIIDGGANIGCFALRAHARFPQAPIICYEPDVQNLAQLRHNLESNKISARVIQKALWSGDVRLFYHPSRSDAGYVDEKPSEFPIDCPRIEAPDGCWLKLDVEGAEYEVIPQLLRSGSRPAIISMEVHDYSARGAPLLQSLRDVGYRISGDCKPDDTCVNITAFLDPH